MSINTLLNSVTSPIKYVPRTGCDAKYEIRSCFTNLGDINQSFPWSRFCLFTYLRSFYLFIFLFVSANCLQGNCTIQRIDFWLQLVFVFIGFIYLDSIHASPSSGKMTWHDVTWQEPTKAHKIGPLDRPVKYIGPLPHPSLQNTHIGEIKVHQTNSVAVSLKIRAHSAYHKLQNSLRRHNSFSILG